MPSTIANLVEVELEEAAYLIADAQQALIEGDWPAAVRATHAGRRAAKQALDALMHERWERVVVRPKEVAG